MHLLPSLVVSSALLLALGAGCGEPTPNTPSTSSSSHWLQCATDADCSNLPPPSSCDVEGYCVRADGERYTQALVFEEEFDGPALDESAWRFETGHIRNEEAQSYTDRAENVALEGGALVLQAHAEAYDGYAYTSGSIESVAAYRYGRIEASIALPNGRGTWPAFWMMPADPGQYEEVCSPEGVCASNGWPEWGDITIMESMSQNTGSIDVVTHFATPDATAATLVYGEDRATEPLATPGEAHLFGVEWGPQRIDWYLDGELIHSFDTAAPEIHHPSGLNPFQQDFLIKLNLAVGGNAEAPVAGDFPQQMRVDWVRVWQYD